MSIYYTDYNSKFCNAIKKYGFNFFTPEILEDNLTLQEACELERKYIKEYDSVRNGYNTTWGGEGFQKCDYDLVIEKDGIFQKVQCKATGSTDGKIDFRITSGKQNGTTIGSLLNSSIDILFCLNQNGTMYNIPFKEILKSGKNSIHFREEPLSKLVLLAYFDKGSSLK